MMNGPARSPSSSSCSELLAQLEEIWNDVGESEADKDCVLLGLERECLEVYRRKVKEATTAKAQLRQSLAAKEVELAALMTALGEVNIPKNSKSPLKEEISFVTSLVDDLKKEMEERKKVVADIRSQISKISRQISGCNSPDAVVIDEEDFSPRRVIYYKKELHNLEKEKSDRLKKVLECVKEAHSLCGVLGLDFSKTVRDVHPSLNHMGEDAPNISDSTLQGLHEAISRLKAEKKSRIMKLKDIFASLTELWDLMESPYAEKSNFSRLASVLNSCEADVTEPGDFSTAVISQAEAEVERLSRLKARRMKELVLRKRVELETVCKTTHIEPDTSTSSEKLAALIDSGLVDPSELLRNIGEQIVKAKDEAFCREGLIDQVSQWVSVCREEVWLDDYNQDENRFSAGKGAHINLQRAERARLVIRKIPAIVDALMSRTLAWEKENSTSFLYDGVQLISLLEDYKLTRQHREDEKRRHRELKKQHDQRLTEEECLYGSKPSLKMSGSFRRPNGCYSNGNGSVSPTPSRKSVSSPSTTGSPSPRSNRNEDFKVLKLPPAPINLVLLAKENAMSHACINGSESRPLHLTLS